MIRKSFAAMLGGAALALLALTTSANADDCSTGACCSSHGDKKCAAPYVDTVTVDHRCYNSKCDDISFPLSPLLPSLFHGWKHKYNCADGHCDGCNKDDNTLVPGAKCGHVYMRKTLIVKIRHEDKPVYKCEVAHPCTGVIVEGQPTAPATPTLPKPESIPAPRPAGPPKGATSGVLEEQTSPTPW